ncbi:HoxN/HupN/NixA family nickel/cobalt transporter [Streptantibioticus silvisoli]|uniref:High frequency lysogenization protein HflD n=1 Tax=Streptantibioticus silvisoli TaxID=2705255 RepID=A0ABT6W4M0_9ACTN|nr:high frequency lysogenization protein HflD [Streptantibioticus silvisoli]MDI5964461.1 high frequency lysogenization protein HflD [Streptantibioticus silvisoli]
MHGGQLGRRAAAVAGIALWLLGAAPGAQAHPLGNFSVNHYTGFTVRADRLDVLAVTDTAEIPTLQAATAVDTDGDGRQSGAERAAWATARCRETAARLRVTGGRRQNRTVRAVWTVDSAVFAYRPGQAGLRTSRLECRLRSPLRLTGSPLELRVDTGADPTRVGWNEITATGAGARLAESTVPRTSVTDELRRYPRDLLSTPRGDTRARFTAVAGGGASGAAGVADGPGSADGPTGRVEALSRRLTSLTGARRLTVPVGLLAVLLSIVLGAGHALLPGHGKTVMAAYLAGRRGRTRDAVTVGATVTVTHTAGVLVVGLCLTVFSSLAGDSLLNWLAVLSGALVAAVGVTLLTDAARRSRRRPEPPGAPVTGPPRSVPVPSGATGHVTIGLGDPGPGNGPGSTPGNGAGLTPQEHARLTPPEHVRPTRQEHAHATPHAHDHLTPQERPAGHAHDHAIGHPHAHPHGPADPDLSLHPHDPTPAATRLHSHGPADPHPHSHGPGEPHRHGFLGGHRHHHTHAPTAPAASSQAQPFTTRGLVGLGVAGGLVPSPSALVVLLGAIALGRTVFGAFLVVAYGLGMAATLTAVGLLLVRLGGRAERLGGRSLVARVRRLAPCTAFLTATLVLVVGLGMMARSLPAVW